MRWVIGDIHGMLKPLAQLIYAVRAQDSQARFLFVGDYVNRGPDSRGVVDLLLRLPPGTARFARGNHDDIFDLILNGKSFASGADPVPVFAWFMAHGLDRTLHSYGIDDAMIDHVARRPSHARLVDLVESIPQDHRTFFRHLPLVIEEPDLFVIHARWSPEDSDRDLATPIAQHPKLKHRVLWERFSDEEITRKKHWQRRGYFGHTPVINYTLSDDHDNVPIVTKQAVLLDTGLALFEQGRLTAYCVESDDFIQATRFGELIINGRNDDAINR
jgi:serine/threonine protein phosphatase 1